MGYSCSVKADLALKVINNFDEFNINSKNCKYIFEIGRENKDGSITGSVSEWIGSMYDSRKVFKSKGNFKINPNGEVIRFPGLSKRLFGVVYIAASEEYDRMFNVSAYQFDLIACQVTEV